MLLYSTCNKVEKKELDIFAYCKSIKMQNVFKVLLLSTTIILRILSI